jgi:hypothetical protein
LTRPTSQPRIITVMNTTTYKNADEAWEAGQEWIDKSHPWEKLDYLQESCTKDFLENHLMEEMVRWMGEDDFSEFFKTLCRHWEIKTPPELDYAMRS